LKIPSLPKTIRNPQRKFWLLENLIISKVTFEQIWWIFKNSSNLKKIKIGSFSSDYEYETIESIVKRCCAMNLKTLKIDNCLMDFQLLEEFFQLTPHLKDITLISDVGDEMVKWKTMEGFHFIFLKTFS
jgi:hypothetical protein